MERTLLIDGKEVKMKASALIPRLYRYKFGRDIIRDMNNLRRAYLKAQKLPKNATLEQKQAAQFSVLDLTVFENVSYIMAKHADASVPDSPEEWLDQFEMFSIYEVLPKILELWSVSNGTISTPKKK